MKLDHPTLDDVNEAVHVYLLNRRESEVPDYLAGEDREAVYAHMRAGGDRPLKITTVEPTGAGWVEFLVELGSAPHLGRGRTMLEALAVAMLAEAGVEVVLPLDRETLET